MIEEISCGAVVYRQNDQHIDYLLIQHVNGHHWSFPKGHVEEGESEVETALREIKEETGLSVDLSTDFRAVNRYSPKENVMKDVIYFIAKVKNDEVEHQVEEVIKTTWLNYEEAYDLLTYPNDQKILAQANEYLLSSY